MKRLAAGLALVAALAATGGCAAPGSESSVDSIRIGVTPERLGGNYNVVTAGGLGMDVTSIYQTLFTATAEDPFAFVPDAATGFELSDDWKTITITLREGIVFSDGEHLTAPGVKEYFETLGATEDWYGKAGWDIANPTLTAPDETTLVITSDIPINPRTFGPFAYGLLAEIPLTSVRALDDLEALAETPVGSGPYALESVTAGVEATLVKNEDYWDADAYPFEEVTILVFEDQVAALNALKAGQIDTTNVNPALGAEAESAGFRLDQGAGLAALLYVADREGSLQPALADVRVRTAMALAFDREAINENLNQGFGEVTSQPFLPGSPQYGEGGDDPYAYDPERARELMAEAGYADGFDLVIPSGVFQGNDVWKPVVQQFLGDIGIRVTFEDFPDTSAFFTAMLSAEYPVLVYGMNRVSTFGFFAAPDALFNVFKIRDPLIDEMWPAITDGPDAAAEEAMQAIGDHVLEEVFLVPFAAPNSVWASAEGYSVNVGAWGAYPWVEDFGKSE
jgi:peptide/nickel transport system substrate-binding protein